MSDANLVCQLGSLAEERITETAFSKKGRDRILHFSNSKADLANVVKSLFDVSCKSMIDTLLKQIARTTNNSVLFDNLQEPTNKAIFQHLKEDGGQL